MEFRPIFAKFVVATSFFESMVCRLVLQKDRFIVGEV